MSFNAEAEILNAIRSFSFGSYGCDEMAELVNEPSLEVGPALAAHIAFELSLG